MRTILLIAAVCLSLCFASVAGASDDVWVLGGFVSTDNRMTIEPGEYSKFVFNENTLGLKVKAFPVPSVSLTGSVEFVTLGTDERLTVEQQQDRTQVEPYEIRIDEAFIHTSNFVIDNLDIKVGKQRIQWGTGDQFNPTDNLNPDNFHDPLDFGEKLATVSAQAVYYAGPVTLTAVFLPMARPSLLPVTDARPIFEKMFEKLVPEFDIDTGNSDVDAIFDSLMVGAIQNAKIDDISIYYEQVEPRASNMSGAFKVATNLGPIDMSMSYAYVWDDFGVPKRINIYVDPLSSGTTVLIDKVDVEVHNAFYRMHVIGADFAASIPVLEIGMWGEGAYFIPEPFDTEYFLDLEEGVNFIISEYSGEDFYDGVVIAKDHPLDDHYFKYVVGVDYTFPGAWYINAQFVRGLPNDNTAELIDHYAFAGIDKPFLNDTIKPRIFAGMDFEDESWILYPQIFFYPNDSMEITIGTFHVFGEVDTKLGAFGDDIVFGKMKVSF